MIIKSNLILITILTLFSILSCKNKAKQQIIENANNNPIVNVNGSVDSLFTFNGIANSEIVEQSVWDFNRLYTDSTKKKAYYKLSTELKLRLLQQVVKFDTMWIRMDIQAYLISKQEKIGNLTPLIIETNGTDFSAIVLVNTDEKGNFVSGCILSGGENSGPLESTDSLLILRPFTRCFFNKNNIKSYSLNATIKPDDPKSLAIIDSISYLTSIGADGNISTQKLDSTRYRRVYKW
jgi:hypothetical protein